MDLEVDAEEEASNAELAAAVAGALAVEEDPEGRIPRDEGRTLVIVPGTLAGGECVESAKGAPESSFCVL